MELAVHYFYYAFQFKLLPMELLLPLETLVYKSLALLYGVITLVSLVKLIRANRRLAQTFTVVSVLTYLLSTGVILGTLYLCVVFEPGEDPVSSNILPGAIVLLIFPLGKLLNMVRDAERAVVIRAEQRFYSLVIPETRGEELPHENGDGPI